MYIVDSIGQILEFNQSALDILGYERDEILGLRVTDFFADKQQLKTLNQQLKEQSSVKDFSAQARCKDGTIIDCLITTTPYYEKGKLAAYLGIFRDVTEQMNAQNALKEIISKIFEAIEDRWTGQKAIPVLTLYAKGWNDYRKEVLNILKS